MLLQGLTNVGVQVTRINPRLASADIICVGTQPLEEKFTGIIRYNLSTAAFTEAVC